MEMDFYTAVDDLNPEDTAGAGMMGFTGFNSACFYRYARIDWGQLVANLNGDVGLAALTVEGFLRAAAAAVPTGKQTSFAANNPPSLMMAVVRADGMGWSLANAFEMPVRARAGGGLLAPSTEALDEYWGQLCDTYGAGTLRKVAVLGVSGEDMDTWVSEAVAALQEGGA
jgi:CRISPR system Cascade subunit CasC